MTSSVRLEVGQAEPIKNFPAHAGVKGSLEVTAGHDKAERV